MLRVAVLGLKQTMVYRAQLVYAPGKYACVDNLIWPKRIVFVCHNLTEERQERRTVSDQVVKLHIGFPRWSAMDLPTPSALSTRSAFDTRLVCSVMSLRAPRVLPLLS